MIKLRYESRPGVTLLWTVRITVRQPRRRRWRQRRGRQWECWWRRWWCKVCALVKLSINSRAAGTRDVTLNCLRLQKRTWTLFSRVNIAKVSKHQRDEWSTRCDDAACHTHHAGHSIMRSPLRGSRLNCSRCLSVSGECHFRKAI